MKLIHFLGKRIGAAAVAALLVSGAAMAQTTDVHALHLQLGHAKQELAQKTRTLTNRAQAMAEAQLSIAQNRLEQVSAAGTDQRSGFELGILRRVIDEARASTKVVGTVRRAIRVKIEGDSPPALEVYAVPLGVLNYAAALSDTKLRNVLELGRFSQQTSPAEDQLETEGDYAVWVVQPHQMDAVFQMVRHRAVVFYRTVLGKTPQPIELTFKLSEQLLVPVPPQVPASQSMVNPVQRTEGSTP